VDRAAFLRVMSDAYEDISFKVDNSSDQNDLGGPLLLVGAGALSHLDAVPTAITFTNSNTEEAANIEILIGRNA
jgi:hypothetical protein